MKKIIGLFIFTALLLFTFSTNAFAEHKRQYTPPNVTQIDVLTPTFESAIAFETVTFNSNYGHGEYMHKSLENNNYLTIDKTIEMTNRIRLNKLFNKHRLDHGYYSYYNSKLLSTKKAVSIEPRNKRLC